MRSVVLLLTLWIASVSVAAGAPIVVSFANLIDVPGVTGELDGSEFLGQGLTLHIGGPFDVLNVGCGTGHTCLSAGDFDDPADFSGALVGNFSMPGTGTAVAPGSLEIDFVNERATTTLIGLSGAVLATFVNTDVSWVGAHVFEFRVQFDDDGMRSVTFDGLRQVPEPSLSVLVMAGVAAAVRCSVRAKRVRRPSPDRPAPAM